MLSLRLLFMRSQLPIFVMLDSVAIKNIPGINIVHHAPPSSERSAFDSMLPHEMTSSGSPIPIKLSVDSAAIAFRIFITAINRIEEIKFGARCFRNIWKKPPPMHLAAITYSLLRSWRTCMRTTFAMLNQLVSPMTIDRLHRSASPHIACINIINSKLGILISISVRRIKNASSHCGARPLTVPNSMAAAADMAAAANPINNEILPPCQIMEKISRPIASVPNRNSLHGAVL